MSDKTVTKIDTLMGMSKSVSTPYRKKRVSAYARVLTDYIDQQISFTAQVDYYTHLIAKHHEWEFVRVYSDTGLSGCRSSNRDGFMQMIADCENGLVDMILTKSL
ncbi:MAG: recombinase family protein [Acutalibacteraceae bacterium]|nr:recombinase family protein [Acutalibacteraceae bacterium]